MKWVVFMPFIMLGVGVYLILKSFIRGRVARWFATFVILVFYATGWGDVASQASGFFSIVKTMIWHYVIAIAVFVVAIAWRIIR